MKISTVSFLEKYKQLFIANTPGVELFAFWKMKYLIETGETFYLPEYDCYYMIRDNHLLVYYSPDGKMHLPLDELNGLDCISLPASTYDTVKADLEGFDAKYDWNLRYDFGYKPIKNNNNRYCAAEFDFNDENHYKKAAELINGGSGWLNENNIRKMTKYPSFDPSLWFFIKDKTADDPAAISISAYDAEVRQTDLDWIFVAPEYQGKGCGRFLIEETIRRCKHKSDNIRVGGTVEFYRKCGFVNYELWVWAPKKGYRFKAEGIQP